MRATPAPIGTGDGGDQIDVDAEGTTPCEHGDETSARMMIGRTA